MAIPPLLAFNVWMEWEEVEADRWVNACVHLVLVLVDSRKVLTR